MTGTMTFAGLDVHARSTHGAAIDVLTGGAAASSLRAWERARARLAGRAAAAGVRLLRGGADRVCALPCRC